MKKILLLSCFIGILTACSSDDSIPETTAELVGKTYVRSSFIIDAPVDFNSDGIYSNDLMLENDCYSLTLAFSENLTVLNPSLDGYSISVIDDGNGNLSQDLFCAHGDGAPIPFKKIGNVIEFNSQNASQFTGTLSNDGTTITFVFSHQELFVFNFFSDDEQILQSDGTVDTYNGGATVVYTLSE